MAPEVDFPGGTKSQVSPVWGLFSLRLGQNGAGLILKSVTGSEQRWGCFLQTPQYLRAALLEPWENGGGLPHRLFASAAPRLLRLIYNSSDSNSY